MLRQYRYQVMHGINHFLLSRRCALTPSLFGLDRPPRVNLAKYSHDYVRYAMWELCAEELHSRAVPGNIAELGVYRGNSAKLLNELFPDRTLYLFDTFAGFDARDLAVETDREFSSGEMEFAETSAAAVLARMPHRERCIIKQGFFPETAAGVNDTFAFVSIDFDLYQPILEGLRFFYPLLAPGGYLFVHDYNHQKFRGAKAAVQQFQKETGIGYLPIPDTAGSVVFVK